jgi:hypothetical protein
VSKLPESGDVFALEVSKGLDVLLRVVGTLGKTRCVVVTKASSLDSRELFELQPFSHHHWNRPMIGGWVSEAAPPELRALGAVALRPGEAERVLHPETWVKLPKKSPALSHKVLPVIGWSILLDDARRQWRWDHERAAVLAEDAQVERENEAKFAAAIAASGKRKATLQKKGVGSLKKTRFFAAWKGAHPTALIKEAEAAMREAVLSLDGKTPAQAVKRLSKLVRTFNTLDERHDHPFDTIDREDIMEAVGTIAFACGVGDDVFEEVIDAERDF